MILRQIRKRADLIAYLPDTVQRQRMRRRFHNHMSAAGITHLRKQALKLKAFRRCTLGFQHLLADHVADRSDQSDLCSKRIFQNGFEQIGTRSFSVCAGNRNHLHRIRGMSIPVRTELSQCLSCRSDPDPRHLLRHFSLAQDNTCAMRNGIGDILMSVRCKARNGDKHLSLLC